jgi:NitT/TauT family transport system permease protein
MKAPNLVKKWRKPLLLALSLLFWFLLWYFIALLINIPLILPKPLPVLKSLCGMLGTRSFWRSILYSVLRILLGAVIGMFIGLLAGVLSAVSDTVKILLSPVFSVIRATPVACFIILAWVFIGAVRLPVFIAALMVAPVMMTGTLTGIESADPLLLEAAKAYRLPLFRRIYVCYLPALAPHLSSAAVNCIGLAWKAGLAAEIIVKVQGSIGYEIWNAKSWNIDAASLFAWTIAVIAISLFFEWLLKLLLNHGKAVLHVR